MDAAAFRATYCNFKNIAGRKQLQLHFEVPIEEADKVFKILGYPNNETSTWVAIALLKDQ